MFRWRNYFYHSLNVHEINYVSQTEIHTTELLTTEPSASQFELDIEKLKVLYFLNFSLSLLTHLYSLLFYLCNCVNIYISRGKSS
jgi:hypothetical protein